MFYKTAAVLAAIVGASALSEDATTMLVRTEWNEFKAKYTKEYVTPEEEQMRFTNFVASMERVASLRAHAEATKDTAEFGITQFADMTPEEFKAVMLTYKPAVDGPAALPLATPSLRAASTPSSFDWRNSGKVTPVKDQGSCGSCWAHGAVETIESQWAIAGHSLTQFSVQQLVSCDTYDGGCRGGDSPTAFKYVQQAGGLATSASYPYTSGRGLSGSCQPFTVAGGKISGFTYATPSCTRSCDSQDEAALAKSVSTIGAPSICVDATNWQDYTGGILQPTSGKGCGSAYSDLDHCVQLTGYQGIDTANGYWIVRNSWGTSWGNSGYIYLQYGKNTCGVADEATLPTLA